MGSLRPKVEQVRNFLIKHQLTDLQITNATPEDGNCVYKIILEQISSRDDIRQSLRHVKLQNGALSNVQQLKNAILDHLREKGPAQIDCNKVQCRNRCSNGVQHLNHLSRNQILADDFVLEGAATLLNLRICLLYAHEKPKYFGDTGRVLSSITGGVVIYMFCFPKLHFQSLVPQGSSVRGYILQGLLKELHSNSILRRRCEQCANIFSERYDLLSKTGTNSAHTFSQPPSSGTNIQFNRSTGAVLGAARLLSNKTNINFTPTQNRSSNYGPNKPGTIVQRPRPVISRNQGYLQKTNIPITILDDEDDCMVLDEKKKDRRAQNTISYSKTISNRTVQSNNTRTNINKQANSAKISNNSGNSTHATTTSNVSASNRPNAATGKSIANVNSESNSIIAPDENGEESEETFEEIQKRLKDAMTQHAKASNKCIVASTPNTSYQSEDKVEMDAETWEIEESKAMLSLVLQRKAKIQLSLLSMFFNRKISYDTNYNDISNHESDLNANDELDEDGLIEKHRIKKSFVVLKKVEDTNSKAYLNSFVNNENDSNDHTKVQPEIKSNIADEEEQTIICVPEIKLECFESPTKNEELNNIENPLFASYMMEQMPKKRGRKPGVPNKPKQPKTDEKPKLQTSQARREAKPKEPKKPKKDEKPKKNKPGKNNGPKAGSGNDTEDESWVPKANDFSDDEDGKKGKKRGRRKQNKSSIIKREPLWELELPEDAFHLLSDETDMINSNVVDAINEKVSNETILVPSNVIDSVGETLTKKMECSPSNVTEAINEKLAGEANAVQSNFTEDNKEKLTEEANHVPSDQTNTNDVNTTEKSDSSDLTS